MKLEIADASDNAGLLDFFSDQTLRGSVELKMDRRDDFFGLYTCQGFDNRVYTLKDLNGKIQASATFCFRNLGIEGNPIRVAFAKDLKVSNNRKAILEWTSHFLPVLEGVCKEFDIQQVFSCINLDDPTALNTFVRPRAMRRPIPKYYLYRKVNFISLHGKYPWAPPPVKGIRIREANSSLETSLMHYLVKKSFFKPFCTIWDEQSFNSKMTQLKGLKLSDYLVALDSLDNVIGCMAAWSPLNIQNFIPISYSMRAHNFRQYLKFLWLFRMTRKLTKPVRSTGQEAPLNFKYLTSVFADNEDIFESLLWECWSRTNSDQFLAYSQVEGDYKLNPPKDWISATSPFALYSVVPPGSVAPNFLHPSVSLNPEVEPYLLL